MEKFGLGSPNESKMINLYQNGGKEFYVETPKLLEYNFDTPNWIGSYQSIM